LSQQFLAPPLLSEISKLDPLDPLYEIMLARWQRGETMDTVRVSLAVLASTTGTLTIVPPPNEEWDIGSIGVRDFAHIDVADVVAFYIARNIRPDNSYDAITGYPQRGTLDTAGNFGNFTSFPNRDVTFPRIGQGWAAIQDTYRLYNQGALYNTGFLIQYLASATVGTRIVFLYFSGRRRRFD